MDLRGLESIQWRGFSDREIQQLHHHHSSIEKVSKTKPVTDNVLRSQHHDMDAPEGHNNGEVDALKDAHDNCDASKPQLSNIAHDQGSKEVEVATPPPMDMPTETDLPQQYVNCRI